jgi:hypothetical protein
VRKWNRIIIEKILHYREELLYSMYLYSNFFLIMKNFGVMVVCGIIGLLLLSWMGVINFGEKDVIVVDEVFKT